jgi:RHS repeat-associated protein
LCAPFNVDSFTGKPDQLVPDEYDFPAREEHNGQGRWVSPDPRRGTGNKYVYADNNPLSNVDLYGLYTTVGTVNAGFQAWLNAELAQVDPLLESRGPTSMVTGAAVFGASENAYLARVDSAFEGDISVETPPVLQYKQAQAAQIQGQQALEAQNQDQSALLAQNQDPNQSQSSSSSSSGSGRSNSPAQGQQPDTTVTIPGTKPGDGTDRSYGPDGRAVKDIDKGHDHGAGDPHAHDWDWSKNPPRQPGRPLTPDEAAGQKSTILDWAGEHKGAIITGGVIVGIGVTILTGGAAAPAFAFVF